jgi:hypothetical protein
MGSVRTFALFAVFAIASSLIDVPYTEDIASKYVMPGMTPLAPWGRLPASVEGPIVGVSPGALRSQGYYLFGAFGVVFVNYTSPASPIGLAEVSYTPLVDGQFGMVSAVVVDSAGLLVGLVTPDSFVALSCALTLSP